MPVEVTKAFLLSINTKNNKRIRSIELDTPQMRQFYYYYYFYYKTTTTSYLTFLDTANLLLCTPSKDGNPKKKYVYDECRRQCQCVNGKLVNCYRVRREFSKLPLSERVRYINVYKHASLDSRYMHKFFSIVIIHPTVNFQRLHSPEELFPFHRK